MHELGLCEAIVGAVEKRAGDREVTRVKVHVGRLHHVHPEAFEQSFAMAAAGGVAGDAQAELVLLPVRSRCTSCGVVSEGEEIPLGCEACGGVNVELVGGDELLLESIEYRAQGPSGPLSGKQGPSGPLSGKQGPSGPLSGG